MKPVYQTRFGKGEGNCLNACVASLLELPLGGSEGVPEQNDGALRSWLLERDMGSVWVTRIRREATPPEPYVELAGGGSYYFAAGISPRDPGVDHAVVYSDGELQHDPHPEGKGLAIVTEWGFLVRMGLPR